MLTHRSDRTGAVQVVQKMVAGGIETLALDLIKAGVADRALFSLQAREAELISAWPALENVRQILEGLGQGSGFDTAMLRRLTGRLRQIRPAAVILHHIGPLFYGGLAGRLAGVPRIVHVEHDAWHYRQNPMHVRYCKVIERLVRPTRVAVSQFVASEVRGFLPHAKFTIIPPAIDTQRFILCDQVLARQALGLDPSWRIVGTAGRLVEVKGHNILVAALQDLPSDIHVVIAGEGPLATDLKTQAQALGVTDRLHLLGRIDGVESVLPAFDVFVLPSLNEGLPRVVLEAQSCGLPVVASNVGSVAEAVNSQTGRLVTAGDAAACARALREVLAQPADAQSNRMFVEQRYNWQSSLEAYRRLLI